MRQLLKHVHPNPTVNPYLNLHNIYHPTLIYNYDVPYFLCVLITLQLINCSFNVTLCFKKIVYVPKVYSVHEGIL